MFLTNAVKALLITVPETSKPDSRILFFNAWLLVTLLPSGEDGLNEDDFFAYEVARAIDSGVKLNDAVHSNKDQNYVLSAKQWEQKFEDQRQWLEQTNYLLMSCQVQIKTNEVHMPKYPIGNGETAESVAKPTTAFSTLT